jgi:hypothetical protein
MSNKTETIASLNDLARKAMGIASRLFITDGVAAFDDLELSTIRHAVETFNDFTPDNDPYGERDFGSFKFQNETIFWKVDYYNRSLDAGSEDPADPKITTRVLTIMLASEY